MPTERGDGVSVSTLPTTSPLSRPQTAPEAPALPQVQPRRQEPNQPRSGPPRMRLTSKQLAAIWALGRKLGHEQQALRQFVKGKFGSQPEFLSREQASQIISAMSEQAGNGRAGQPEPGSEG